MLQPLSEASHRVWLVDRAKLFREALKTLLEGPQFHVTLDAPDMDALLNSAGREDSPDLIVVSVHTDLDAGGDEEAALHRLCRVFEPVPVLILAETLSLGQLKSAMKACASGYLLRDIPPASLRLSLELIAMGEKVLPSDLVTFLVNGGGLHARVNGAAVPVDLSPREKEILICLACGHPNKVVANRLDITEATVKVHVKALFKKIRARNRTEAAIWALNHGFDTED